MSAQTRQADHETFFATSPVAVAGCGCGAVAAGVL